MSFLGYHLFLFFFLWGNEGFWKPARHRKLQCAIHEVSLCWKVLSEIPILYDIVMQTEVRRSEKCNTPKYAGTNKNSDTTGKEV